MKNKTTLMQHGIITLTLSVSCLLFCMADTFAQQTGKPEMDTSIAKYHFVNEGTEISLQLMQDISSGTANVGDVLKFETNEPVIVNDSVIVPIGTKAFGKVTEAAKRQMLGKPGTLSFSINFLMMASGKIVKITTEEKSTGKKKLGGAIVASALISPLFLMKKGKDVKYEKGHVFTAFVEKDTQL